MKSLVISMKTPNEALQDFKKAYMKASAGKLKEPHYEISFDNRRDFDLFVRNIHLLSKIIAYKPQSVYELGKLAGLDTSNLHKTILFFERIGVVKIKEHKVNGRTVKTPIVDYNRIEFDLAA